MVKKGLFTRKTQGLIAIVRAIAIVGVITTLLTTVVTVSPITVFAKKTQSKSQIAQIDEILNAFSEKGGEMLTPEFCEQAGTPANDWLALALARCGGNADFDEYLDSLKKYVDEKYKTEELLDSVKATEWHRIALLEEALGADPSGTEAVTEDEIEFVDENRISAGDQINLIADGTYNRADVAPIDKQGINGWIWALITLDSQRYGIPKTGHFTRADAIEKICACSKPSGGFALAEEGLAADVDITAMALQALAPYTMCSDEIGGEEDSKTDVKASAKASARAGAEVDAEEKLGGRLVASYINRALFFLSNKQNSDGSFSANGVKNAESTAQVAIALCSLGIDPTKEGIFIKSGRTVFDALCDFAVSDYAFCHTRDTNVGGDTDSNTVKATAEADLMATGQALMAISAYKRLQSGECSLFDIRDMTPDSDSMKQLLTERKTIKAVSNSLQKWPKISCLVFKNEKMVPAKSSTIGWSTELFADIAKVSPCNRVYIRSADTLMTYALYYRYAPQYTEKFTELQKSGGLFKAAKMGTNMLTDVSKITQYDTSTPTRRQNKGIFMTIMLAGILLISIVSVRIVRKKMRSKIQATEPTEAIEPTEPTEPSGPIE